MYWSAQSGTDFTKTDRVDKEFRALEQGRLSHAEFKAHWEEKLEDCADVGIKDVDDPKTLWRLYLSKLNNEMRLTVMSKG